MADKIAYLKTNITGAVTSDTLDFSGYANSTGSNDSLLKITYDLQYKDGILNTVKLQHSSDKETWVDLWNIGDVSGSGVYKVFYSFNPFIRVTGTYTAGNSEYDTGTRVQYNLKCYGLPNWDEVSITRPEYLRAVYPSKTITENNFYNDYPQQSNAAKKQIETMLLSKGINPNRLFTDGKNFNPTIPGLATPAAYLVWWYINLDAVITNQDDYKANQETLVNKFNELFELAVSSGLDNYDRDNDSLPEPDEGERLISNAYIYR